jgi:NAD(P)-dependent dehydrogenase (short-subunit alcohol dehydrogenase family)
VELTGKVVVVTGGAGGIGAALSRRFVAEGAAGVVVADLDGDAAREVAAAIGAGRAVGVDCDVTSEPAVRALVAVAQERYGPVDLFCSNAGITVGSGVEDTAPADWQRAWEINVLAHVYAARAVLPSMLARGSGYLLQTCSAAGLLTAVGDAPYTVTKHAAVGLAEWLAVTYGDRGIRVSALCPQGVRTPMLTGGLEAGHAGARVTAASGPVLTPEQVADAVVDGLAAERFLILPHPEVAGYLRRKVADPDAWLGAMRAMVGRL